MSKETPALSPLQYLKRELDFKSADYVRLTPQDKDDLKDWAREEMAVLGITVR